MSNIEEQWEQRRRSKDTEFLDLTSLCLIEIVGKGGYSVGDYLG